MGRLWRSILSLLRVRTEPTQTPGRVFIVDREGVVYRPSRRVVLRAKT